MIAGSGGLGYGARMEWTLRRMLEWMQSDFGGRGIASPRLDAELLVAHALGKRRIDLYLELDRPLEDEEKDRIRGLVKRRRAHEPIAYILGYREFYGRRFEVTKDVLIPRPDTETLVARAIEVAGPGPVLDLCTGSGCVGISVALETGVEVVATDVSEAALAVAQRNAEALGVRVRFVRGDLFAGERGPFSVITANPPYLAKRELAEVDPDVREHEPEIALVAGESGLEAHARIAKDALRALTPEGVVLVEVGAGQAAAVGKLYQQVAGFPEVRTHEDLGGIERVVEARRVPEVQGGEASVEPIDAVSEMLARLVGMRCDATAQEAESVSVRLDGTWHRAWVDDAGDLQWREGAEAPRAPEPRDAKVVEVTFLEGILRIGLEDGALEMR